MGRRLTGSLRRHQGLWWASVPEAKGAGRRREESFGSEDDARSWLAQAVSALQAGRPVPDADPFRTHRRGARNKAAPPAAAPAKVQPDIASVAQAWMNAAYEDLRRGGPERAERVRRIVDGYLVPWFAPRTTTVADVTYFMVHDWLLHLVGREHTTKSRSAPSTPASAESAAGAAGEELSLAEVARLSAMSLPTVRRRWREGQLPGAYRDPKGHVRVPVEALDSVRSKRRAPTGLSQRYVADALWVLRRVLGFARANGLFPPGFDPTESLDAPTPDPAVARTRRPTRQPRPLSLPECARVAAHLHPVHQIAFWLQRIMGLRISEAFGVLLGDVVDLGDTALLAAQGQGGRSFNVRDDHGVVVAVPYKQTMKTAAGSRVLVVPASMLAVIHAAVDAFHTDPDTGRVDPADRLVPGIYQPNRSGQEGYRHAFEDAVAAEGLATADLGFRVSSHLLRKSLATDLAWQEGIEDTVRRRFMGHRAGDDVFGRIYTLDHPEIAPLVKVAAILDDKITSSIETLLTPTTRRVHWATTSPLAARAEHVNATLAAAGWLIDPGNPDAPLCDAERVASELDIYPTTARRWMTDGTLPAIIAADAQGVPRRYVRLAAVWAHRDRLAQRILLPDLAERLGVRYHEAYHMVRRLGLALEQHPTSRVYEVTPDAADALRAELQRIQALHRRSMKLPAAATQLHLAASTVRLLAQRGELDIDPETDSSGLRFVTSVSVKRYWIAHHEAKRRAAQPVAAVPVAEVARFTGETPRALMDLVRAGILEQVPGRRAAQLTAASLRAWMADRDPDDTDSPTSTGPAPVTPLRAAPDASNATPEPVTPARHAGGNRRP
ncbi:MAG: site-specific integrase [Acidimicrobiales bacterium]